MIITTRSRLTGALSAVALAAILLPGATASGTDGPPPAPITGGGVLRLHLADEAAFFRFESPTGSGQPTVTQRIRSRKCVVTLNPASSLVTLTPTPAPPSGVVGLADEGLGVKSATDSAGAPCGRVDGPAEALTIALAGALAGRQVDFAELDIEAFNGVTVRADSYLGANLVDTSLLMTPVTLGAEWSDDQNVRWVIDPALPFDRMVLSVDASTPAGAFSLKGGDEDSPPGPLGAALQTRDTLFQLTEITGIIDCGETEPPVGGGETPEATLSRGANLDCEPLPYLLRSDPDDSVLLQKDASSQPGANFFLDIVWDPEATPTGPLPLTSIDYDGPGGDPPQDVQWCGGTASSPQLPPGQLWCLARQLVELTDVADQVQVSERYYGAGDPRWTR